MGSLRDLAGIAGHSLLFLWLCVATVVGTALYIGAWLAGLGVAAYVVWCVLRLCIGLFG